MERLKAMKLDPSRLITAVLVGLFMFSVHTTYHHRHGSPATRPSSSAASVQASRNTTVLHQVQRPALPETILGQTQPPN